MESLSSTIQIISWTMPSIIIPKALSITSLIRHRDYFGNREPYAITVAATKLYILTNPSDAMEAYKNMSTLSFDEFVRRVMRTSGSSEFVVHKMFETPDPKKAIFPNPHNRPLAKLARELHMHQLFPGAPLDELRGVFLDFFNRSFTFKNMAQASYASSVSDQEVVLPLNLWTSDVMICAGQEAYFGPHLAEIDSQLTWDFLEFDDYTWQVLYQYPRFLASDMFKAKEKVIAGLERYFEIPEEKRGKSSWFTPAMEKEMRNLGFSTHDVAVMMMTIYWGINTNTRRACFWMFSYILFDPELVSLIGEETNGAFADGDIPDIKYLEEECPHLNGIWNETIRLSAYSSSVRYIMEDTTIGGKILRKGNRVMIPNRQLHFNASTFGEDAKSFKPTRFFNNEKLLNSKSWKPFGGGTTICPGRFIAKQAVILYVAMILHRFDLEIAGERKFPKMEEGNPVLGIMSAKAGDDLSVKLRPRKK
ncbi:hypothetical protein G7Y89_g4633 [Cudoniella acicularis]|uniref:Cytochrome P450 n=1 Tax=Cudoniella acicularis TaxID=354080 RepID=A0A8H4RR86_9HELO|nr:hypothetical protein G7Y89_g4633 [Cudoniella acicularis]